MPDVAGRPVPERARIEWCDTCHRPVANEVVVVDKRGVHRCPLCDHALGPAPKGQVIEDPDEETRPRAPWHFKVLLIATGVYLVYRAIWIVQRLTHHG